MSGEWIPRHGKTTQPGRGKGGEERERGRGKRRRCVVTQLCVCQPTLYHEGKSHLQMSKSSHFHILHYATCIIIMI